MSSTVQSDTRYIAGPEGLKLASAPALEGEPWSKSSVEEDDREGVVRRARISGGGKRNEYHRLNRT